MPVESYYLFKDEKITVPPYETTSTKEATYRISGVINKVTLKLHVKEYSGGNRVYDFVRLYVNDSMVAELINFPVCEVKEFDITDLVVVGDLNHFKVELTRTDPYSLDVEIYIVFDLWIEVEGENVSTIKYVTSQEAFSSLMEFITSPQLITTLIYVLIFILLLRMLLMVR